MTTPLALPDDADLGGATVTVAAARISDLPARPDWLTSEERARAGRLRIPGAGEEWVAVWSWVRSRLGVHLDRPPAAVPIDRDHRGRPRLAGAAHPTGAPCDFNISHAGGTVVLAIADRPVGIDIESEYRGDDLLDLAAVVAHPDELTALASAAAADRPAGFARLWTRKEALLKAIGTGFLSEPRTLCVGTGRRPSAPAGWLVVDLPAAPAPQGRLRGAIAVQTARSAS